MKARRLRITPALWIEACKSEKPLAFRVARNALPGDARCAGMKIDPVLPDTIVLWIESAAFRDDDPDDLPEPIVVTVEVE